MQYHEVAMMEDDELSAFLAGKAARERDPIAEFLRVPARKRGPLPDWAALAARSTSNPTRRLGE
jgi:hypothetical protein